MITLLFSGWRAHSGRAERYQQPIVQICSQKYPEDMKIQFSHLLPIIECFLSVALANH